MPQSDKDQIMSIRKSFKYIGMVAALFAVSCDNKSENDVPSYCDMNGFTPKTEMAFWDHPWYDFILMSGSSTSEPVTFLDMQFYKSYGSQPNLGKIGKIKLDVDPNDCGACLIISTNCVSGICESLYFAGEGELNISSWGQDGEKFSGELKDAVFFEIEIDESGYYRYKDDGKIWCLQKYDFDTTIQSVKEL